MLDVSLALQESNAVTVFVGGHCDSDLRAVLADYEDMNVSFCFCEEIADLPDDLGAVTADLLVLSPVALTTLDPDMLSARRAMGAAVLVAGRIPPGMEPEDFEQVDGILPAGSQVDLGVAMTLARQGYSVMPCIPSREHLKFVAAS